MDDTLNDQLFRLEQDVQQSKDSLKQIRLRPWHIFILLCMGCVLCVVIKRCNKRIGTGHKCFKALRWCCSICYMILLLLHLLLCVLGVEKIDMVYVYMLIGFIVLGPFLPSLPSCYKKIPIICCGRRKYCFCKQTKRDISEFLSNIDQHVPSEERLSDIKEGCRSKGVDQLKTILETKFSNKKMDILFTGSSVERFGVPTSADLLILISCYISKA